jgi:ribose-phosphate pyrophosphokinase
VTLEFRLQVERDGYLDHARPVGRLTMNPEFVVLGGTANPALASTIAEELGVALGSSEVERFPDGELSVRLHESVRGLDVFVVQPTSPPANDHLLELLAFVDACRRAGAERLTAVVPYFGYARSDRRDCHREPIMASLVAGVMECAGVDRVLLVDVHSPQTEGFFRIPVDNLTAVPALCKALRDYVPADMVVVSPDAGRVKMATEYGRRLGAPLAILHKRRESSTETDVTHVVGDVRDRPCLVIDDMISTGGTVVESLRALREAGARPEFYVAVTHSLMLGPACTRFAQEGVRRVFQTNTVTPREACDVPVEVVSVAPLLAAAIRQGVATRSRLTRHASRRPRRP